MNDAFVVGEMPAFRLHKFKDLHKINSYEKGKNGCNYDGFDKDEIVNEKSSIIAPVHDEHVSIHFPGLIGFMKFM